MAPALSSKEFVHNTFSDLEGHRDLLSDCISEWKQLEDFLSELEKSLQLKLEELGDREKVFQATGNEKKLALDRRDEAISVREEAYLARVLEQKGNSLAALEEERRNYLDGGGRETATNASDPASASVSLGKGRTMVTGMDANGASKGAGKSANAEVRVRPEIKSLCEIMDGEGIRKYIVNHRKEFDALRNEMPLAFQSAIDPSRLVLRALDGFDLLELDPSRPKETLASANLRACILLLECLSQVLADPVLGVDHPMVSSNIKDSAKEVANLWKSKSNSNAEAADDRALNAQAFLQLLETFGIASEFNADELLKLVACIARRKQTPALCRSLGLTAHMPDLVDTLNKDGKPLECLSFAHHFGIMDRVQPAPMLKAFLKEIRKNVQYRVKNAANPVTVQFDVLMKELSAIKAVMRAVEDYNLASQYSTDGLLKRVRQLEKMKADKRKAINTTKSQVQSKKPPKKPRVSGGYNKGAPPRSAPVVGFYTNSDHAGATVPAYGFTGQTAYERPSQASYNSLYGSDNISPGALQGSYLYPDDIVGSSLYQSAPAYSDLAATYANYQYGNGLPTASAYQLPYLH